MQQDPLSFLGSILSGQALPAAAARSNMDFMGAAQKQGRKPEVSTAAMPQASATQPIRSTGVNPALQAVTKTVTTNDGKGKGGGKGNGNGGKGKGKGKGNGNGNNQPGPGSWVGHDSGNGGLDGNNGGGNGGGNGGNGGNGGKGGGKGGNGNGGNGGPNLSPFEQRMNKIANNGPAAYTNAIENNLGMNQNTIGYGGGQPKKQHSGMTGFMDLFAPNMPSSPSIPPSTPPHNGSLDPKSDWTQGTAFSPNVNMPMPTLDQGVKSAMPVPNTDPLKGLSPVQTPLGVRAPMAATDPFAKKPMF